MPAAERDPNLLRIRTGTRPPLFLVAAPGVNALGYVALARGLPEGQPVYVVQPMRRGRRFPAEGIGPGGRDEYPLVAAEYVASIRSVEPSGPYYLGGMCDGAIIAFEMARMLEAGRLRVALLCVLDTWPLENTSVYPLVMLNILRRSWRRRSPEQRREAVLRKAAETLRAGAALLHPPVPIPVPDPDGGNGNGNGHGAIAPPMLSGEARRAAWRARLWPGRGFEPPVIEAPITVLRVPGQPYWRIRDDALGWRERTRSSVAVHILPGDHGSLTRSPNVERFSRALAVHLAGALCDG
jgi:thioesterase domain-containing protein